jgi:hypothetical protein
MEDILSVAPTGKGDMFQRVWALPGSLRGGKRRSALQFSKKMILITNTWSQDWMPLLKTATDGTDYQGEVDCVRR